MGAVSSKLSEIMPSPWSLVNGDAINTASYLITPPSDHQATGESGSEAKAEIDLEQKIATAAGYGTILNYLGSIAGSGLEIFNKMDANK